MTNKKTVPNQKVVRVEKEICDKQHLYAAINLEAMELAAQKLDAGAFKLWCYFAKNQNGYEFALSSKAAQDTFGIKIKQYNNAVEELIAKGFLVNTKGNNYLFKENPVNTKSNNAVITKKDNAVITKSNNELLPLDIRNNTDNIFNTTRDNTKELAPEGANSKNYPVITVGELIRLGVEYELVEDSANLIKVVSTGKIIKVV